DARRVTISIGAIRSPRTPRNVTPDTVIELLSAHVGHSKIAGADPGGLITACSVTLPLVQLGGKVNVNACEPGWERWKSVGPPSRTALAALSVRVPSTGVSGAPSETPSREPNSAARTKCSGWGPEPSEMSAQKRATVARPAASGTPL